MAYQLPYTGESVRSRLQAAANVEANTQSIANLETYVNQHNTSIIGNTQAIHDLQMDVAAIKMSGGGGGGGISVVAMTQAQYNAITPDANTLYLIY